MIELHTERLRLLALTREQLRLYLHHVPTLEQELGLPVSRAILMEPTRRALAKKVARMATARRSDHAWHTYWLAIVTADGFGAGLIGFKGPPNKAGEVEIGYGIDPAYEGRGFTTEAARRLIAWAFQNPNCQSVVAPGTRRANLASNRVLEKLGMRVYEATQATLSWRVDRGGPGEAP